MQARRTLSDVIPYIVSFKGRLINSASTVTQLWSPYHHEELRRWRRYDYRNVNSNYSHTV
jgi:hypothetical protein